MIQVEHLTYQYPGAERPAVEDLSLEIGDGQFVAVLGHNGSGKSTLAKHFNGILHPTTGRVLVNGLDTSIPENALEIRRTVGMVFQNPDNQIVANIVEDDVAFAPENLGVPSEEIRRRVDEALRLVGMYDYRMHAPHLLSGGQKQRVAIARAVLKDAPVLLLDEATASLDSDAEKEVQACLDRVSQGRTTVTVAHRLSTIEDAHRILVMDGGRVVEEGDFHELMALDGRFRELYENQRKMEGAEEEC